MVKKLIIEKDDEQKMLEWDEERLKLFREKYNALDVDDKEIYVLSVDIADKNSLDKSIMTQFRIVDGKYIFEGVVEL